MKRNLTRDLWPQKDDILNDKQKSISYYNAIIFSVFFIILMILLAVKLS